MCDWYTFNRICTMLCIVPIENVHAPINCPEEVHPVGHATHIPFSFFMEINNPLCGILDLSLHIFRQQLFGWSNNAKK